MCHDLLGWEGLPSSLILLIMRHMYRTFAHGTLSMCFIKTAGSSSAQYSGSLGWMNGTGGCDAACMESKPDLECAGHTPHKVPVSPCWIGRSASTLASCVHVIWPLGLGNLAMGGAAAVFIPTAPSPNFQTLGEPRRLDDTSLWAEG